MTQQLAERRRFWAKVIVLGPGRCWLWTACLSGPKGNQYGMFTTGGRKRKKLWKAHRYSWMITYGGIPNSLQVCRQCDNRLCVNPKHLFLGTQRDNMDDMSVKGRRAYGGRVANKGEDNPKAKLTNRSVQLIKNLQGKVASRKVAQRFGVEKTAVLRIWNGLRWRHL